MGKLARLNRARRDLEREAAGAQNSAIEQSQPNPPPGSPWDAQPADRRAQLESLDSFASARNRLRSIAAGAAEWAGIPVPIDGEELVIDPSYAFAKMFEPKQPKPDPEFDGAKIRNSFFSIHKRCTIVIWEKDGKIEWGVERGVHHFDQDIRTLGCSYAWGIEQESNAIRLLGEKVRHHTFKQYMLTGMFLERSQRSGIMYMFRRLKPTVAIVAKADKLRILCCLCMHPIAYYADSWAGAMCPTDDVIAHLMLMRADEHMYWRRCNQHPAWSHLAGL